MIASAAERSGVYDRSICHKCGREIREFHSDGQMVRLRRLLILLRPVIIEICPERFPCPNYEDHPTTTQQLDWLANGAGTRKPTTSGCYCP